MDADAPYPMCAIVQNRLFRDRRMTLGVRLPSVS